MVKFLNLDVLRDDDGWRRVLETESSAQQRDFLNSIRKGMIRVWEEGNEHLNGNGGSCTGGGGSGSGSGSGGFGFPAFIHVRSFIWLYSFRDDHLVAYQFWNKM